jgi:hypothetical protein
MSNSEVDLSAFDVSSGADKGARLTLRDKHGKVTEEWIDLLGADSKEYQSRLAQQNQARIDRIQQRMGRASENEILNEQVERLAVATKDWSFKSKNGEKVEPNFKNALNVYINSPLIREQAEWFVHNRANFTQA